jgi:predicted RNase H-like HicB family nuclease
MKQTKGYTMNNEEKIIVRESALDEAMELLTEFLHEQNLNEKQKHAFMAVIRERLDFHVNRLSELGIKLPQIEEV